MSEGTIETPASVAERGGMSAGRSRASWKIGFICALYLVVGLIRITDTSVYTPDSCRYVILGSSLARGEGWIDATKPVPERFMINPPLYSLLLAPAELLFPMSLTAAKVWTMLWGAGALLLLYLFLRRMVGETAATAGAFLFSLNPLFVIFSGEALSDAPFLFFLLLAIVLSETEPADPPSKRLRFAGVAICVSALPLMREAGAAAVAASVLYLLARRKWSEAAIILASSAALLALWYWRNQSVLDPRYANEFTNPGILFTHFFTTRDASVLEEFALRIRSSAVAYAPQIGLALFGSLRVGQLSDLIVNPSALYQSAARLLDIARPVLVLATFGCSVAGAIRDLRSSRAGAARLMFVLAYLFIILIFPAHDIRYVLPLLPFLIYYGLLAARRVFEGGAALGRVAAGTAAVLMVPNLLGLGENVSLNVAYNRTPEAVLRQPLVPAAFRYQWKKMGLWIGEKLPQAAVIASPVKDIVLVSGGRKVLEMDPAVTLPEFEAILRNDRVGYVFTPALWRDLRTYEFAMRESRRFWFEPVPEQPSVMRIHSRLIEPIVRTPPHETFDAASPTELLRRGRGELVRGEYQNSLKTLSRALDMAPDETDIVYQVMIADLFNGDTAGAAEQYRKILALPQTYAYIEAGRRQWDAIETLGEARSAASPDERAAKVFSAAQLYWNIGYPRRSAEVLNTLLRTDSLYSIGLLWGIDYNLQLGDTALAKSYLARLKGIDGSNPLVNAFTRVIELGDSINASPDTLNRSRMHLEVAGVYQQIELGERAFDEAERSLGDNHRNSDAMILLGDMLRARSHLLAAASFYSQALLAAPSNRIAAAKADSVRREAGSE